MEKWWGPVGNAKSRYEQQDWRVELLPFAMQNSGADAMTEISLSLHEGPILLGHVIPKGYELTEDLPWVLKR